MKKRVAAEMASLRRYALALTRDPARAEDLVQETLSRALAALDTFRVGADVRVWLFRILHNLHVDAQRRALSERQAYREVALVAPTEGTDSEFTVRLREVLAALDQLPAAQADAVRLVALRDLSYSEAAQVLEVPIGTLMSRLARGREALREHLKPQIAEVLHLPERRRGGRRG